ncbi:MAG: preprotein translocase subunit YajC [Pleurocapsa minor GSE-CHR-MK-17-07R]|nr:preprotein translocase subunit YajC [Pleurocapsa minor GSE-CHR-MK 17-07R]
MSEFVVLAVVMVLALGAYWSLVIFPRQREFSKQQRYVRELHKGDEMITYGGMIGKVIEIDADAGIAYLEIADGVIIRVVTASLVRPYDPEELAEAARRALGTVPDQQQQN